MPVSSDKNSSERLRGLDGKFIGVKDPPLLDVKVANPVNYLKIWWAKVVGNEGVEFNFRIRPLTAIAMSAVFAGAGFGLGRLTVPPQVAQYVPFLSTPSPTPNPWKETAYTGVLRFSDSTDRYYLQVGDGETVTLEVLPKLNLSRFVGRRIMAIGVINQETNLLRVEETTDLEVLPTTPIVIPTLAPSPTSEPTPVPS